MKEEEVILSEPYGMVAVDTRVPCVIVRFLGFANRAEFMRVMDTGLAYYAAHSQPAQPWGWVGDVRQMGAIPQAVQQWLTDDWNPRAVAAGIREISIVLAETVFGQLATQQYVQQTTQQPQLGLTTAYYPSLFAAKQGARQALRA